ncbi:uncharacterized protein [Branchiostoma lanceolatum]|uniref:uncharacterized protein n=1 Tax=Branchiostoma lanceolatum TaxID=7740 RepID=UPI003456AB08
MIVYKRAANIVSDMITEVSDNDEAANIVSVMDTEVSDNDEAANIVSDMDTEVSDNDETRVPLSSVENSATSVWRPWATFGKKLAQTTSQIMPMRRESSTTTRDKENGHLLTQRGKSGALRKEDTPRVHSVVRRTIDWMWRNLRYLIGQHKHSENPVAVEASRNFERYIKLHMFWNRIIAHCRGYLQRQIYTTKIKNRKQVDQKPSSKKPLENHTFLLSGRIPANCGKKQDLCAMIRENGGRVMDKVPPRGVSVDITVLTTQKEIDKGMDSCKNASRLSSRSSRVPQPNDTIIKAFQRKWKILSFQYVLDCIKLTSTLDKHDYFLNLESLQKAPSTCLASIEETLPESLYFGKGRSAITQLRRKMKANKKPKVMKTKRKGTKRLSIWARFVSKESQKLKGHMKRGNCIQNAREISRRWKTLTSEQRRDFTEESRKSFQKRQLEKSTESPKEDHPNRSPAYKTAIAGLSPLMLGLDPFNERLSVEKGAQAEDGTGTPTVVPFNQLRLKPAKNTAKSKLKSPASATVLVRAKKRRVADNAQRQPEEDRPAAHDDMEESRETQSVSVQTTSALRDEIDKQSSEVTPQDPLLQ